MATTAGNDPAGSPARPPVDRGAVWVWTQSVLMAAVVAAGPVWPGTWHHHFALTVGGLLFAAAGALGIAGVVQLGANRTPFPRPRDGSRLIENGVYAYVRHPLYVSVILASLGWALLFQSGPALVLALILLPFFDAKARREERWLREMFPSYVDYARRVKRFVPGVY